MPKKPKKTECKHKWDGPFATRSGWNGMSSQWLRCSKCGMSKLFWSYWKHVK